MTRTPSPWNVGKVKAISSSETSKYAYFLAGCGQEATEGEATKEEAEANRLLIAAAPDLLEALRGMVIQHSWAPGDDDGQRFDCACGVCTYARTALIKAEVGE